MDAADLAVHDWGIDRREDDGADGVIYDDKMDFAVFDGPLGDLVALVDVKTKSSTRYMGEFNERHYTKYYGHSAEYDCPIYVVFFQVDGAEIEDCIVGRVDAGAIDENIQTTSHHGLESFPDKNSKARFPEDHRIAWDEMIEQIKS